MIKKLILLLLVVCGGVMQMQAEDVTLYIGTSTGSTWTIDGAMTSDGENTYTRIVVLPQFDSKDETNGNKLFFTIFKQNSISWDDDKIYTPTSKQPWVTNSVCEFDMQAKNELDHVIVYPVYVPSSWDSRNYARAIRIDFNTSTLKLKVTRLIAVGSGYNNWNTSVDYLTETANGSKIYTGNVTLEKESTPEENTGFKFVYMDDAKVVYGAKNSDGYISNNSNVTNFTVSKDGVYTLNAQFTDWRWIDPVFYNVPVTMTYPYSTFSSKYALDFTNVTYVRAYQASMSGTKVLMTRVSGKVPANTGLFLARQEGVDSEDIPTTICATELTGNLMKASTGKPVVSDNNLYSLVKRGDDYGFAKVPSPYTWAEGKAYLETPAEVNAPSLGFSMDDDETTTIHSINIANNPAEEGVMYNLEGKRIDQPSKGVYIVNGKKVIIK